MAHYGILGIGVLLLIIGIIMLIIGWVLSSQSVTGMPSTVIVNGVPTTTTTSGWTWFLIIGGVILFIIGLIMILLSFYWRPAPVVVPASMPQLPAPGPSTTEHPGVGVVPPHAHVKSGVYENTYVAPHMQVPSQVMVQQSAPTFIPPQSPTIVTMEPQRVIVRQSPPIIEEQPTELPQAPIVQPVPLVRQPPAYVQQVPVPTTIPAYTQPPVYGRSYRKVGSDQYDPDPMQQVRYVQDPARRVAAYHSDLGYTTGVLRPAPREERVTFDPPNQNVNYVG